MVGGSRRVLNSSSDDLYGLRAQQLGGGAGRNDHCPGSARSAELDLGCAGGCVRVLGARGRKASRGKL